MTAKATAAVLLAALGSAAAIAVAGSHADSTTTTGPDLLTATVYATVTVTQEARYQGRAVRWWARRAVKARREVNALRDANRARLRLGASGLARAFLCIHGGEGSWSDPNAPYWGGLQMDGDFMAAYGAPFYRALGTADHWPAFVQVAVAMAAYYSGRGFEPWPNTARACGLR